MKDSALTTNHGDRLGADRFDDRQGGATMSTGSSTRSMMLATVASRGLGFLKAILLVAAIGGTSAFVGGQAFEIANSAPTYLFALVAGGVLGAILVPQIVRDIHAGAAGQENTDRLLTIVMVGGALLTIVATIGAPGIVWAYAATWSEEWRGLATSMAYWCLPQIFFLITFAVLGQVLNARGIFGAPAWAPTISNVVGIFGILVFLVVFPTGLGPVASWTPLMIAVLCGSVTLGVATQSVLLVVLLRKIDFHFHLRWGFAGLGHMSKLAGWTVLGVLAGQIAYLVTSNVASHAGETLNNLGIDGASLNSMTSAYLLMLLPHGVVTVSLTTALYTRMSAAAAQQNLDEVTRISDLASKPVAYVSIAATAVFVALGPLITELLWGTPIIGQVLQVLSIGLVGFSQAYVLNRTSFALQDARGPFVTQLVVALVSAAGAVASALLLPPESIVLGIAVGVSVANFAGWLTAHIALRRTLEGNGHRGGTAPGTWIHGVRLAAVAALSAGSGLFLLSRLEVPTHFLGQAGLLLALVSLVCALFAGVNWLLGDRTLRLILAR